MADSSVSTRLYDLVSLTWRVPTYIVSTAFSLVSSKEKSPDTLPEALRNLGPCRYPLDNSRSATLTLPDGRKLGYAQYGDPKGYPIFCFHGLPGSRMEYSLYHDLGMQYGARLISPERPGFGWSSPQPNRTILGHARDVEHLAEHLGIEEFKVLGMSGGGPYVLASAYAIQARKLKGASVVCGLGMPDMNMSAMQWKNYIGFTFGFRYFSWAVPWMFKHDVLGRLDLPTEKRLERLYNAFAGPHAPEKDREVFSDVDFIRVIERGSREMFAQGYDGMALDGKIACWDWGFRIQDIRKDLPIQLWYGKLDANVPADHGIETAARLGGHAQLTIGDETHASMEMNYREQILKDLLAC